MLINKVGYETVGNNEHGEKGFIISLDQYGKMLFKVYGYDLGNALDELVEHCIKEGHEGLYMELEDAETDYIDSYIYAGDKYIEVTFLKEI